MAELSDVLRGGGSMPAALTGFTSSTGDCVKLSSRLGVDELARLLVVTFPNRNGGSRVSALVGRGEMWFVENPLLRVNDGRVTGRLRL